MKWKLQIYSNTNFIFAWKLILQGFLIKKISKNNFFYKKQFDDLLVVASCI